MVSRRALLKTGLCAGIGSLGGCARLPVNQPAIALFRTSDVSEAEQAHARTYIERLRADVGTEFSIERKPEPYDPSGDDLAERAKSFNRALGEPTPAKYSNVLLDSVTTDRLGYAECSKCGTPNCRPGGHLSDVTIVGGFGDGMTPRWQRTVLATHNEATTVSELETHGRYVALVHELGHTVACAAHESGNAWTGTETPGKYAPDGRDSSVYASPMVSSYTTEFGGTTNLFGDHIAAYDRTEHDRLYYTTLLSPDVANAFAAAVS